MTKELHHTLSDDKRKLIISSGGEIFYEPTLSELSTRAEEEFFRGVANRLGLYDDFIVPYMTPYGEIDIPIPVAAVAEKMRPLRIHAEKNDWDMEKKIVANDSTWVIGVAGDEVSERERIVHAKNDLTVVINKPGDSADASKRLQDLLETNEGNYLFSVGAQAKFQPSPDPSKRKFSLSQGSLAVGIINPMTPESEEAIKKMVSDRQSKGLSLESILGSGIVTPPEIGFVQFRDVFRAQKGVLQVIPIDMKVLRPGEVSTGMLNNYAHGYNSPRNEAEMVMGL